MRSKEIKFTEDYRGAEKECEQTYCITLRKVSEAIKKIKLGKVPAADGLLGSYYTCFED